MSKVTVTHIGNCGHEITPIPKSRSTGTRRMKYWCDTCNDYRFKVSRRYSNTPTKADGPRAFKRRDEL